MTSTTLAGIQLGMPDDEYHSSPALSSTGIRRLLDSPARFKYWRDHAQAPKPEFDLGHAVHAAVLGTGAEVVEIPEELLASNGAVSTKEAKEFIAQARADGYVPMKRAVVELVDAMAGAVLARPSAADVLAQPGDAEASLFATDPETGVQLRARFDYLSRGEFGLNADLKTTARRATLLDFEREVADHGYHIQDSLYRLVHRLVFGYEKPMQFLVVEKTAPHLAAEFRLSDHFQQMGDDEVRKAINVYAECLEKDEWPGYPDAVQYLSPPTWLVYQTETAEGGYDIEIGD